jgi:hypothetical protein
MPRSLIMDTRSRSLNLKLRYQRTHSTTISWSKCHPLNNCSNSTYRDLHPSCQLLEFASEDDKPVRNAEQIPRIVLVHLSRHSSYSFKYFLCCIQRNNKSQLPLSPGSKTRFSRLLLVATMGAVNPLMPRSALTLASLMPLRLIVSSTLLREAPELDERLGPTKME